MTITITTEEELKEVAAELLFVLAHLRHWTKEWNEHYGGVLLGQKKTFEKRADELLERLKIQYAPHQQQGHIHIEIKEDANK